MNFDQVDQIMTQLAPTDAPRRNTSPEEFAVIREMFKDYHIKDQITKVCINMDDTVIPVFCAKTDERGLTYKTPLYPHTEFASFFAVMDHCSKHYKKQQ